MKPFRYEPKSWFSDVTRRELDLHENEVESRKAEKASWQAWEMCRATLKSWHSKYMTRPLVPCVYVDDATKVRLDDILPPAWKKLDIVVKIGKTDLSKNDSFCP